MDDAERQGRIGELLRVAILQAELQQRVNVRLLVMPWGPRHPPIDDPLWYPM